MIFGRGGGGGVINRVLKEADGVPIREVVAQGGQFWNKRVALDVGDRVSDNVFFASTASSRIQPPTATSSTSAATA